MKIKKARERYQNLYKKGCNMVVNIIIIIRMYFDLEDLTSL